MSFPLSRPEKHRENAELLQRLLKISLQDRPLKELLDEALEALVSLSWLSILPKGGIFLAFQEGNALRLFVERNLGPSIKTLCARVRFGHCLCGRVAAEVRTQYASSIDSRHETTFEGISPHGHYIIPIKTSDRLWGVLMLYLPHGHARNDEEIVFLESYCDILGLLIEATARKEALDSTRRQLSKALAETDALMKAIKTHTIFSLTEADGTIVDVNEAECLASGYSRDELIGRNQSMLNSGDHDSAYWAGFWRTVSAGKPWRGEIRNRRKDGSHYWVDTIVMPLMNADGGIDSFVSVRFDITNRKHAESSLARMGRILDQSSNEIYVFDARTLRFTLFNRGARENLGYGTEDVTFLSPVDIKPEYTEESFRDMIEPLLRRKIDRFRFETVHERKDGSRYPVEVDLHYAADEAPPVFVAIVQDITKRKAKDGRIKHLAFFDPLTGLANRAQLRDRLEQVVARAHRSSQSVHVLYLDLDRFKEINDTRGHAVGDAVLVELAKRFKSTLQESETIGRLGGDEFVAVIENATDREISNIAGRILKAVRAPAMIEGKPHNLGVSIGVSAFPSNGDSGEVLLQLADIAMYAAKVEHCGYRFYDSDLGARYARKIEIAERLQKAIQENRLDLHFQPIVDLSTGRLVSMESLLRWQDKSLGAVHPGEFIPIAEERNLIGEIGVWVIDQVCRQLATWRDRNYEVNRVAINVAVQQMDEGRLLNDLLDATRRYGIPAGQIEVEITESGIMKDPKRMVTVLADLKREGFYISIDDFGTGYSCLAYLKSFSVDRLKIDMEFVRDLLEDSNSESIIRATAGMARSLGLAVLAEGVETEEQAVRLRTIGCDEAQGYLYGRPLPPDEFAAKWLA